MPEVSRTIAPGDRMLTHGVEQYFAVGQSAIELVRNALQTAHRKPDDIKSILDFASGHGRVTRWLRAEFPTAEITASDLLNDAVDFCIKEFAAKGIHSTHRPTPALFNNAHFDLLFAGSLFTHLDEPAWDHFLALFEKLLAPNAILLFTTHGQSVAQRMHNGDDYGYKKYSGLKQLLHKNPIKDLLAKYDRHGFAYLDDGEGFGISLSSTAWVNAKLKNYPTLQPLFYTEQAWLSHQDAIALLKPVSPPH